MTNGNYFLLGTQGCHLCELAEHMVDTLVTQMQIDVEKVDIAEHEEWQEGYAFTIPVLLNSKTNKKLCWPFTEAQAFNFFKSTNHDH